MDKPSLRGSLLVAGPAMLDPNFARTVVLLGEHSADGAMGVILNRPSEATVADAVPGLAGLVDDGAVVHVGGPVAHDAVTALAEFDERGAAAAILFADIGFARADAGLTPLAASVRRARVFVGYAGWTSGQLESELEREDWIIAEPVPDDVFADEGPDLWSTVLERQGGHYRLLARMPLDPSLN